MVTLPRTISRRAKALTIKLTSLPARTKVTLTIMGAKTLATTRVTASSAGTATIKVTLGKRARKAIRAHKLRQLRLTLSVTPPNGAQSTLTLVRPLSKR